MIINAKKAISGGSKILTYFFTRNVPKIVQEIYLFGAYNSRRQRDLKTKNTWGTLGNLEAAAPHS